MQYFRRMRSVAYTALALGYLSHGPLVQAAPLDLSNLPLFLSSSKVPANILFMVDDSGSMDWEVMTQDADSSGIFSNTQPDGSTSQAMAVSSTATTMTTARPTALLRGTVRHLMVTSIPQSFPTIPMAVAADKTVTSPTTAPGVFAMAISIRSTLIPSELINPGSA